ncbi:MAG: ATP-binding protein, partial [Chloroflexota bacterium]
QAMANGISAEERITNSLRTLHLSLDQSKVALILLDKENRVESISHNGFSNSDLDYLIEVLVQESMTDTPNLVERRIRVNGKHPNGWPIGEQYQIVVPFHLSSGERGGLILEHGDDEIINEQTLRLLQTLSVSFAATLENGQLFEQIEAANERLRELDRLKTQFLANMSHELRTPLNSIIGFSKLILRGIDGPITEAQEDDLTSIYYSGQHLLKLINDILDLTKLEAGKMPMSFESVDLVPIAEGTFVTTRGLIREEFVKLILDVADDLPQIEADPLRIKQIILNLLSNAAKFTATGSITLKLEKDTIFDDHVVISVQDTGTGIATDDLPKLFELFEQGRHARMIGASGTGLGLPIVKELVQLHHGSIDVKSALDKGTTFFVTLPVSQPEAIVDELADLPAYTVSSANEREEKESFEFSSSPLLPIPTSSNGDHPAILLVDDEPSVLKLYQRYLSNQPNEIICAVNGIEALTHLKKRSAEIGLVILDIHMPGLNGWDVLAEMRSSEALTHIPVAICSLDVDSTRAMNSGAQMVLHKPIISEDLSRVLSLTNRKSSEQA